MEIKFYPCMENCASKSEREKFLHRLNLQVSYLNAHINIDKYTDPTERYMNKELAVPISRDREKKVDIYVTPIEFAREESYFQIGQVTKNKSENIFRVEKIREYDEDLYLNYSEEV